MTKIIKRDENAKYGLAEAVFGEIESGEKGETLTDALCGIADSLSKIAASVGEQTSTDVVKAVTDLTVKVVQISEKLDRPSYSLVVDEIQRNDDDQIVFMRIRRDIDGS